MKPDNPAIASTARSISSSNVARRIKELEQKPAANPKPEEQRPEAAAAAAAVGGLQTPSPSASIAESEPCPHCGGDITASPHSRPKSKQQADNDAQRRITELEAQVKILTSKATTAVDKLADYEDELRQLKSAQRKQSSDNTNGAEANEKNSGDQKQDDSGYFTAADVKVLPPVPAYPDSQDTLWKRPPPISTSSTPVSTPTSSTLTRFPSLFTRRAPAVMSPGGANSSPSRRENDLAAELKQERSKRQEAEAKVSQVNSELEELSVSLFQQANEMVAAERKARAKLEDLVAQERKGRAKLEERAGMLEEKVKSLEKRDGEKRKRLERLEMAVSRIERVRGMLNNQPSAGRR